MGYKGGWSGAVVGNGVPVRNEEYGASKREVWTLNTQGVESSAGSGHDA